MTQSISMFFGALAFCLLLGDPAQAAGRKPDGCQVLQDRGAVICMAKVSCSSSAGAIAQVRSLFAQCAAGAPLPRQQVLQALDQFESNLYFQCCIGNALASGLSNPISN